MLCTLPCFPLIVVVNDVHFFDCTQDEKIRARGRLIKACNQNFNKAENSWVGIEGMSHKNALLTSDYFPDVIPARWMIK